MKRSAGPDLQSAIQFLSEAGLGEGSRALPPGRIDYESLSRLALEAGHEVSPEAVRDAFRLIMRARLAASRRPPPGDGGDR